MALPPANTERLTIRPWQEDQLEAFHAIWGDPEVIWWGEMADEDASRELLAEKVDIGPGLGWAAMIEDATGLIVGNVALQPTPDGRTDVEVGWHLARRHWGRGFAIEAARAVVSNGFDSLGVSRIVADIVPHNVRSRAVATRLGMHIGEQTERVGLVHDVWVLEAD